MKKHFYQLGKKVAVITTVAICALLTTNQTFAQGVRISGATSNAPHGNAILDLTNSLTKGFLVPQVANIGALPTPSPAATAAGMLFYVTGSGYYFWDGTAWVSIAGSGSAPTAGNDIDVTGTVVDIEADLDFVKQITAPTFQDLTLVTQGSNMIFKTLVIGGEVARFLPNGNFGIGDNSPSALFTVGNGDLFRVNSTGDLIRINNVPYTWPSANATANGQVLSSTTAGALTWNDPGSLLTAGAGITIATNTISLSNGTAAGQTYVTGNTPFTPALVTMSGDATIGITGIIDLSNNAVETAEIQDDAVTFGKIQNISGPAVIGKPAAGPGDPTTITATANNQVLRYDGTNVGFGIAPVTGFSAGAWKVFYSDASGVITEVALGSASQALVSNGPASAPTFQTVMTNPMNSLGDMIYGLAGGVPAELASGTGILHGNGGAAPTWSAVNLASADVTGILPLVNGGTGANITGVSGGIPYFNSTTTMASSALLTQYGLVIGGGAGVAPSTIVTGNAGDILLSGGSSAVPVFTNPNLVYWKVGGNAGTNPTTPNYVGTSDAVDFVAATNGVERMRIYKTADGGGVKIVNSLGIGGLTDAEVIASTAKLDIDGDNTSTISLQLRSGNFTNTFGATQIAFGQNGLAEARHAIKTRHQTSSIAGNAVDFFIWRNGDNVNNIASKRVMSIDGAGGLSLLENDAIPANSQYYTRIVSGDQAADLTLTLPVNAGGTGNILQTNGAGVLSWSGVGTLMADLTATNGLNLTTSPYDGSAASAVKLGGSLIENTTITQTVSGNESFTVLNNGTSGTIVNLASSGDFIVQDNGSTAFIVNDDGNVGIGGASGSYKLRVTGKVKSDGINETSDARLKKNVNAIEDALHKVMEMRGVTYNWKTEEFPERNFDKQLQFGLIAQDLEKVIPELVDTDNEGWKSIEYSHIVPVLIEAIKEQQKIIDGQNTTITDLKASLENVLNRVNIIEKNADINNSKVEK
jgi:hypothetical protein